MRIQIRKLARGLALGTSLATLVAVTPAWAQVTELNGDPSAAEPEQAASVDPVEAAIAEDAAAEDTSRIVVTGTLVRGIAPPGANVISLGEEQIQSTGATTTAQLLQTVPQLGSFNSLQAPAGFGNSVTVNRPNLRSLPGFNTAGGSTTLVLLDGHRMVGAGVTSTTPDPDAIPPGAIQRLEVLPDGGSAVYGSDAVAGVLNFITRKKFDGLEVSGHYGFADDYAQGGVDAIIGKDWGDGGIYASYSYTKNDLIRGRDRDYVQSFPIVSTSALTNGRLSLNCAPGNIQIGTTNFGLPSRAATPNQCDLSDEAVVYPALERHAALVGFTQDLNDSLTIDIKAFYTHRDLELGLGLFHPAAVTLNATNPFFAANRIGTETSHTVTYSFGDANSTRQDIALEVYGITPTLTYRLGDNFQLKAFANFGESTTESHQRAFNAGALSTAITAGLFNPYNPTASNPGAVAVITNFETYGKTRQEQNNFRAIIDGDLFTLPGGAVKIAVGGEYLQEKFNAQFGAAVPGLQGSGSPAQVIGTSLVTGLPVSAAAVAALPRFKIARNIKSAFGEIIVPLFGADNATTGLQRLTLSAAGRYDDYSDVGSTFNPKVGLTWEPFNWIKLRGNWGESFNAPSLADAQAADFVTIIIRPTSQFGPAAGQQISGGGTFPNVNAAANDTTFLRRGNSPGTKPQTAKTFSIGADVTPLDGVKLSATYYNIKLKGVISIPGDGTPVTTFRDFPNVITLGSQLPAGFIANLLASATAPLNNNTACLVNGVNTCPVYAFVDLAKSNQGDFKTSGLDLSANVRRDAGFAELGLDVNANYELERKQKNSPTVATIDQLRANTSRFRVRSSLSAETGGLFGQVTWSHSAGYKVVPAVGFVPQTRVSSFDVFDLFFRYDVPAEGVFSDLEFTLTVNNVFDQDPPEYRLFDPSRFNSEGYINGNTLGRLIQFGVKKKF